MDRMIHQSCRKEIGALKKRAQEQQEQLQACAEQMVALQTQLKQEQLERCALRLWSIQLYLLLPEHRCYSTHHKV